MPRSEAPVLPTGSLLVLREVFAHPGSSINVITVRTELPQSYVSETGARLRERGMLETTVDPSDGRRTLVRLSDGHPGQVAGRGGVPVDATVADFLDETDVEAGRDVLETLETLAARFPRRNRVRYSAG